MLHSDYPRGIAMGRAHRYSNHISQVSSPNPTVPLVVGCSSGVLSIRARVMMYHSSGLGFAENIRVLNTLPRGPVSIGYIVSRIML